MFLTSVPDKLHSSIEKDKLIKNIKSLYQSKGTKRASEIFLNYFSMNLRNKIS